jgi:hypothetical protein
MAMSERRGELARAEWEPEGVFAEFVRNATASAESLPVERPPALATEENGERVFLLTHRKALAPTPVGDDDEPPREITEMGRLPAGKAARLFGRMTRLVADGRFDDVRVRLDDMITRYPRDLLFLRQVAEFHIETGDREGAMGALFTLARRLFEQHHLEGMRQALERVLELEPTHQRAFRLLGLLEQRPATGSGA